MIVSRFRVFPEIWKKDQKIALALVAALTGVALSLLLLKVIKNPYHAVLMRALLALCIVFALKSFEGRVSSVFGFVGKYATIMYLTHVLIIILLPGIVYYPKYSVLIFLFFAIACMAVAMAIDWFVRATRYDKLRRTLVNGL